MITWKALLRCTAYKIQQFPAGSLPEVALAGRSNVGKSSLLNKLAGQKLARVSSEPGMTRSVNFFDVQAPHPFTLVDLPGFGYASRSKDERKGWASLVEGYIERRGLWPWWFIWWISGTACWIRTVNFRNGSRLWTCRCRSFSPKPTRLQKRNVRA